MPATRACGPSRHRSTCTGPWAVRPRVATSRSRAVDHEPLIRPAVVHRQTGRGQVEQPDAAGERTVRGDGDEPGQITGERRRRAPRESVDADVRAVRHALPAEHGDVPGLARETEDGIDGDGHVFDGFGRRDEHEADVAGAPQRGREARVERPVDQHDQPARSPHRSRLAGAVAEQCAPPRRQPGQPRVQVLVVLFAVCAAGADVHGSRPAGAGATGPTPSRGAGRRR